MITLKGFIPLSVPNFSGNEKKYVMEAIDSEWVSTAGKQIEQFEENIAEYVGAAGAVACQSGTAGIHLAIMALGIKSGDIVLVPTLTFIAAVNPVRYAGAFPVFLDCDNYLTIDPDAVEKFCKEECKIVGEQLVHVQTKRRVKAMIVVHVFGNIASMDKLMRIANQYHIAVIEDATEALGSYYTSGVYKGKYAGTIGKIGVYSFNGNKIITTGGGGMVVSNDISLLKKCRHLSTQAKVDTLYFDHDEIGYNYRMTNLQAALGLAQLEQLEDFIEIKRNNYNLYSKLGISLLPFRKGIRGNYWFYSYQTLYRDELIQHLNNNLIQSRPIWKLIHTLKPYQKEYAYNITRADYYYNLVVNIPCGSKLCAKDVGYVAERIKAFEKSKQGETR